MLLHVESKPNHYGDREPVAFFFGNQRIAITRIEDRWMTRDYSYYKVQANDGAIYILRHNISHPNWELTLFQAQRDVAPGHTSHN